MNFYSVYQGFNRRFAILGSVTNCLIMHHTFGIIGYIEEHGIIQFVKIEFVTFFNILPVDFHILIPIRTLMHVVDTQSMDEFMDNCPIKMFANFISEEIGLKVQTYVLQKQLLLGLRFNGWGPPWTPNLAQHPPLLVSACTTT